MYKCVDLLQGDASGLRQQGVYIRISLGTSHPRGPHLHPKEDMNTYTFMQAEVGEISHSN